jgi:hypothetical protein
VDRYHLVPGDSGSNSFYDNWFAARRLQDGQRNAALQQDAVLQMPAA